MVAADAHTNLYYTLDAENRIVATSPHWDDLALENDGPMACAAQVMYRNVLDFVTGDELRMLLAGLFKNARDHQRTVRVPFRCDAPTRCRHLMMSIAPRGEPVAHCEYAVDPTARPAAETLPEDLQGGDGIRICAWCNRIKLGEAWRELEEDITHPGALLRTDDAAAEPRHLRKLRAPFGNGFPERQAPGNPLTPSGSTLGRCTRLCILWAGRGRRCVRGLRSFRFRRLRLGRAAGR